MTELVARYNQYQQHRGFSPDTIRRRACTLGLFARLIDPRPTSQANADDVTEFLSLYRMPRTRHAYRSDLAAFYKWAHRRGLVASNPCDLVDPVKVPRSLPRPIPAELVPSIVAAALDPDTRLMIALAAYAGLRRSEIAALSADDVTATHLVVRSGKGAKDRAIPLHPVLRGLLAGRRGPLFDVTAWTVSRRIRDHLHACGIEATAHQLRHTFGTELARVCRGDLLTVGALMGHESPDTTRGYTALSGDVGVSAVREMFTIA